jgi:hypothetical protein
VTAALDGIHKALSRLSELRCQCLLLSLENHAILADLMKPLQMYRPYNANMKYLM